MNREQMINSLILDGFLPLNDPYNMGSPRFHTAFITGVVNVGYLMQALDPHKEGSVTLSTVHSWTDNVQGSWDAIPDAALQAIYGRVIRWKETGK